MSDVFPGDEVLADDHNDQEDKIADLRVADAYNQQLNTNPTTTSASYVNLATTCGVSFIAPANGHVMIDWFTEINTNVAGNVAACTIEVRAGGSVGSGTVIVAAADSLPLARGDSAQVGTPSAWYPVTGLTPGAAHNVRLMFRSDGVRTITVSRRGVRVRGWG